MKYQVSVKIRSDAEAEHPPYVYERTTVVRLSQFSRGKIGELIEEARTDYEQTYPHNQGRTGAMLIPSVKVAVLEVD